MQYALLSFPFSSSQKLALWNGISVFSPSKLSAYHPGDDDIVRRRESKMTSSSSNNIMNPSAREAMDKFKMEAAAEVGVNLKQGYNGDLTSRQAGSVGGQMVKKMIQAYENGMK